MEPEFTLHCSALFLSTPSARRATPLPDHWHTYRTFLSTPSARRATACRPQYDCLPYDFYPRPPRGGRQVNPPCLNLFIKISIHALREEGD